MDQGGLQPRRLLLKEDEGQKRVAHYSRAFSANINYDAALASFDSKRKPGTKGERDRKKRNLGDKRQSVDVAGEEERKKKKRGSPCFFLRGEKSLQDGKRDGIKERTNIERDGNAYKALLRLVFISNRASRVECGRKSGETSDEKRRNRRKTESREVQKCIPLHPAV